MSKSISLGYREGASDKVYHVQIEPKGDGFVVNFQFGRRGSTLSSGTKTASPVDEAAAEKIFNKLVAEKTGKGYTVTSSDGAAPTVTAVDAGERSGLIPMLLNPIDESIVHVFLNADQWIAQEKKDGVRQFITRKGSVITGGNRTGKVVAVSQAIADAVLNITATDDFILDGEAMGDGYWPFDILELNGVDLRGYPLEKRLWLLESLLNDAPSPAIGRLETARTAKAKHALFNRVKAERGEGIVFKKLGTKYVPNRPNSGGDMLKFKFLGSATCIVKGQNGSKRSVILQVRIAGTRALIEIGKVTIPPNYEVPAAGALVEIQYMNILPGGSLYQGVYRGPRNDKTEADSYDSLKFKPVAAEADDAEAA
jgi:bifunctional non-homologous end joining protein LigD